MNYLLIDTGYENQVCFVLKNKARSVQVLKLLLIFIKT